MCGRVQADWLSSCSMLMPVDSCNYGNIDFFFFLSLGREKRMPLRSPISPRMDRPRGQGPRPVPPQGDRYVC